MSRLGLVLIECLGGGVMASLLLGLDITDELTWIKGSGSRS